MEQFGHYNQKNLHTNVIHNRVYINRNFNRIKSEGAPTLSNINVMYFNPDFTHTETSQHNILQHKDQVIRPRIHVNPNFLRSKPQDSSNVNSSQINLVPCISRTTNACYPPACTQQTQTANENHKSSQLATVSRYSLVRQEENKIIKNPHVKLSANNTQQTVKVNKYKSVSLNTVKKNLASDKSSSRKINETTSNQSNFIKSESKYRISLKPILNNGQNTRYKYTKRNSITTLLSDTKRGTVRRASTTLNKSLSKNSFRQTKKFVKGAMKKNNIPCPLFKKYGKCLRMIQGSCDYLHDKKHVSICRKFLKGICHDKQCLLSHDLTDKKMPTCYFYLQGICTKESCPYLHVKLNDKTKICPDFLKGYCEKGDKCLHRHVNISPDAATKLIKPKKQSAHNLVNKRIHLEKTICRENIVFKKDNRTVNIAIENLSGQEAAKDLRYFRDVDVTDNVISGEKCDCIKPTRCKLGTLPSFIQL